MRKCFFASQIIENALASNALLVSSAGSFSVTAFEKGTEINLAAWNHNSAEGHVPPWY